MERFDEDTPYNFKREGSFGRFVSGKSFPVEYFLTHFKAEELNKLTFARDVKPEKLDFDLLIQRDIDDERVREKIQPYLSLKDAKESEIRSKVVFFPPLLAAIIPTKNKKMLDYYPNESAINDMKYVVREWPGLFKLTLFSSENPDSIRVKLDTGDNIGVALSPVKLEVRIGEGAAYGAKFVVIDGQHRLAALKEVYNNNPEMLEEVVVPVCILFSPNSTDAKVKEYEPINVPTVTDIFRYLFVDVNTTMELVGGHFNILLSDQNIGSIACRRFCDVVLKEEESLGEIALATIEWNTKKKKDSTVINKKHSITSIGVIEKALTECLKKNEDLTIYLLNLVEVEQELYPQGIPKENCPDVTWERFSYTQKKIIEQQVVKYLVPCLKTIFFGINDYGKLLSIFTNQIHKYQDIVKANGSSAKYVEIVLAQLLEYKPIPDNKEFINSKVIFDEFEDSIDELKETQLSKISKYAIFQRGLIQAWLSLLQFASEYHVEPLLLTTAFVKLINHILRDKGRWLSVDKEYMQHAIYNSTNINPKNETRTAIANILYAFLGSRSIAQKFAEDSNIPADKISDFIDKINEEAQRKAASYLGHYQKERFKYFKGSYIVDFSLTQEDRDKLAKAEIKQREDNKAARSKKIPKSAIDNSFDKLVEIHIKCDVENAAEKLKKALEYDTEILLPDASNSSSDLEDEES